MDMKRRNLVSGASALTLAAGPLAAYGQDKRPAHSTMQVASSADPADFEAALRAKFAAGSVLNWTGGDVRLKRPIAIDVTESLSTAGVDLNGAKVIADFNDASRSALTIRIPAERKNVAFRGLKIFNGSFMAASPAQDAVSLICLTNQSWIFSWKFINLDIEAFARDGLFFDGSVFEGDIHATTIASCGRNGMTFRNDGPKGDIGIVSAISIFGGQLRKNGNAGIETQSVIAYQEPRDLNISQTYFVENKGPGLLATAGLSMAQGCGFENNGQCGIKLANEGRLYACRASTYGVQPYLVDAFFKSGSMVLDACRIEGYSGFEGKMKLGRVNGLGSVTLRDCGDRSSLDILGAITVKTV
jgi:hypothetical protein